MPLSSRHRTTEAECHRTLEWPRQPSCLPLPPLPPSCLEEVATLEAFLRTCENSGLPRGRDQGPCSWAIWEISASPVTQNLPEPLWGTPPGQSNQTFDSITQFKCQYVETIGGKRPPMVLGMDSASACPPEGAVPYWASPWLLEVCTDGKCDGPSA